MAVTPEIPAMVPVGIRVDATGRLRVGNSRVMVEMILSLYRAGESAEALLADFPSMDAADLYATIAFYHRYRVVMDAWVDAEERAYEAAFEAGRRDPAHLELVAKLRARAQPPGRATGDPSPGG